jgi:hypothetical protein
MSRPKQVYDFNDTVAADLLTIHAASGQAYNVLSLVCLGSRYHVAVIVKKKDSETMAKQFLRNWVDWAGAHRSCNTTEAASLKDILKKCWSN